MSEWKEYRLEQVIEKFIDYRGKTPAKSLEGIPLITAKVVKNGVIQEPNEFIREEDYDSWMRRGLPKKNDVILTTEAPLGEVALVEDERIALAQRIILLRGKTGIIDNIFLKYLMQSRLIQYRLKSRASGSTVQGIKSSQLKILEVPVPDLGTQKFIATILSTLDQKIALLRLQNETLEAIAQTLFQRWFVDFEFPNAQGQPYRSSGGEMQASELGEIPEGWEVGTIDKEVDILGGGTPSTKEPLFWKNGDIDWYSPTDLTRGKALFSQASERKISEKGLLNSSAKLFPPYCIMMTSRATIGEISINTTPASTNQGFITLVPNTRLPLSYLLEWVKSQISKVKSLASGSTFPELSKSEFREFEILLPSESIIADFDNAISVLLRKIENNTSEVQTLIRTRDTLLPKLMSGEIRIPNDIMEE